MTKHELMHAFAANHSEAIDFVNNLDENQWNYAEPRKWSAGQQLKHLYLTILPFPRALQSKSILLEKFGSIQREKLEYEEVIDRYMQSSRKAPGQYVPDSVSFDEKPEIIRNIRETISQITMLFLEYDESELDHSVLPHPLLNLLTIREMFYLMTYHPLHHLTSFKLQLDSIPVKTS
ncbi:DinB superfamily protein [compost metagenome]